MEDKLLLDNKLFAVTNSLTNSSNKENHFNAAKQKVALIMPGKVKSLRSS